MDYPSTSSGQAPSASSGQAPATRLCKYQWDYIHDPQKVWFKWLEKEDEGAISSSYKHASGREYGWLAASQESGKDGGCIIGFDTDGGCSYGKYQIAVRKTMKDFITWLNKETNNGYAFFTEGMIEKVKEANSKKECFPCEFTKKWNTLCGNNDFNEWQQKYIMITHYQPLYNLIMSKFKGTSLFNNMSAADEEALKEICISLSVQHGRAFRVFQMALLKDYTGCSDEEILDTEDKVCSAKESDFPPVNNKNQQQIKEMQDTANKITMSEFIDRVYAARKIYVKTNKIQDWENMVKGRYKNEPRILKTTLGYK